MADPCSSGFLSQLWNGNAILCSDTFKSSLASSEAAQIQSVADNAATNYGVDSPTAKVADATAKIQQRYAKDDTEGVVQTVSLSKYGEILAGDCDGAPGVDLSIVGGPCLTYSRLKWIGAGLLALLLLAYISPFIGLIPRRGNA